MKNFTKTARFLFLFVLSGLFSIKAISQTGQALDFDGTNDYVEIPYNTILANPLSVEVWVKIKALSTYEAIVSSGRNSAGIAQGFALHVLNGKWVLYVANGTTPPLLLTGPSVTLNTWTHLAATYNPITHDVVLYVNGAQAATQNITIDPNPSYPIRIGAGNNEGSPAFFLNGQIDDVRFWGKTLSPAEIAANMYKQFDGTESDLIAYYSFNEGIANGDNTSPAVNTLNDLAPGHFNGTLYNFTLNGTSSNWVGSNLVLPVNLVSFTGSNHGTQNDLSWTTATEENSSYFEIQRSTDGISFSEIGKVAASGNSNNTRNYTYTDNNLSSASNIYYYRLKLVDKDGAAKYSPVINIKTGISVSITKVYPNPTIGNFTITINDKSLLNTKVSLSDISGKTVKIIPLTQNETRVDIAGLVKGMYILKFENGKSVKVIKE